MEYRYLEAKYKFNRLSDNKIESLENIYNIYRIDALDIAGYAKLSNENKDLYKAFIINFFNNWGLEARNTIQPLSFNYVEEVECFGKEDINDDSLIRVSQEIYNIDIDGKKNLLMVSEDKDRKLKIVETIKKKYLRFEYKIYGRTEFIHVLSEKEWY